MSRIQKIAFRYLVVFVGVGLIIAIFEFQDNSQQRNKAITRNLEVLLKKIKTNKEKNSEKDYFQRKEELMWGGGKSGGRERDTPKTPFDDLINHPGY